MMRTWEPQANPGGGLERGGFSLLEATLSIAILSLLVTSVFTVTLESMSLVGETEADCVVQVEADRALGRLVDVLHKSGRVEERRVQYPRALKGGEVLEFRLPDDLDGNGFPFDRESGEVEWSPHVFSVQRSADGTLWIYRSGAEVYMVARHVRFARFETAAEDPSLHLNEISIVIEIERSREATHDIVFSLAGNAHMRN